MSQLPNTRHSLLVRLQAAEDQQAWREFLEIYEPAVYRLARRRGLQHADALDITQEVLASIAKAIRRWDPDPARGRFRGWLFRIARNLIADALAAGSRRPRGSGQTTIQQLLEQQPAAEDEETDLCRWEYRRAAFQWAAEKIRGEFQEKTWEAFWRTTAGNEPISEAAARLGMSIGAVYAARSRVLARLRVKVEQLEGQGD